MCLYPKYTEGMVYLGYLKLYVLFFKSMEEIVMRDINELIIFGFIFICVMLVYSACRILRLVNTEVETLSSTYNQSAVQLFNDHEVVSSLTTMFDMLIKNYLPNKPCGYHSIELTHTHPIATSDMVGRLRIVVESSEHYLYYIVSLMGYITFYATYDYDNKHLKIRKIRPISDQISGLHEINNKCIKGYIGNIMYLVTTLKNNNQWRIDIGVTGNNPTIRFISNEQIEQLRESITDLEITSVTPKELGYETKN